MNDTKNYKVTLGELDTKDEEEDSEQVFKVKYLKRHPLFVLDGYFNDIMLLKLDRDIRFNRYVRPACFPRRELDFTRRDLLCVTSGWGTKVINATADSGQLSRVLKYEMMEPFNKRLCNSSKSAYKGMIFNGMLCAGFRAKIGDDPEKCAILGFGDSGGPLVCQKKSSSGEIQRSGRWISTGIVSFGEFCDNKVFTPGVFTRVWHYRNYIIEMMNKMDEFDNSELEDSDEEDYEEDEDFLEYYMSGLSSEEDYDDDFVISYSQMKEIMRRRPKYKKLLRKLLKGLAKRKRRSRNKKKGVRSRVLRKKIKRQRGKNRSRKIVISLKERKLDNDKVFYDDRNYGLKNRVSNDNNKDVKVKGRIGGYVDEDLGVSVYNDYGDDNGNSVEYYSSNY